jgi:hypothetical protein
MCQLSRGARFPHLPLSAASANVCSNAILLVCFFHLYLFLFPFSIFPPLFCLLLHSFLFFVLSIFSLFNLVVFQGVFVFAFPTTSNTLFSIPTHYPEHGNETLLPFSFLFFFLLFYFFSFFTSGLLGFVSKKKFTHFACFG